MTLNFVLRNYKKRDDTQPIRLRITIDRKHAYINTDISVLKKQWNENKQVVKNHPNQNFLNSSFVELQQKIQRFYFQNSYVSAKLLVELYKQSQKESVAELSFFDFFDSRIEKFTLQESYGQVKRIRSVKKKLHDFAADLNWNDLTPVFLNTYEKHLLQIGNKKNTIAGNMSAIKATINDALKQQITKIENPFTYYVVKWVNTPKTPLTITQIEAIESLVLKKDSWLFHAKNMFLFAFYASGMRISDVAHLTWKNIKKDSITYVMGKSKERAGATREIPVHPKLHAILNQYKDKDAHYVFPVLYGCDKKSMQQKFKKIESRNSMINSDLKTIAKLAGIETNLTFHNSKHSFTDWAVKNDVDLLMISKLLGHTKLTTTEHYLKDFYKKEQVETINNLFNR